MKKIFTLFYFVLLVSIIYGQTQRLVLVEEFTQASCGPCGAYNPGFNSILSANSTECIGLKYQTVWPGTDPMNAQDPTDVSTRVTYYKDIYTPWVFTDGDTLTAHGVNAGSYTASLINTPYAVQSPFSINLSHTWSAHYDSIFITCNITAAQAISFSTNALKLRVALVEQEIDFCTAPGTNGEKTFLSVMRKMIPSAAGTAINQTWTLNQTDPHTFNVALPTYIYDKNQVGVVAFIQLDDYTLAVQQAAYSAPIPLVLDAGFACGAISIPAMICSTSVTPVVTLKNYGSTTLDSATINYKVDASSSYTAYAWTGTIAGGSSANITMPTSTVTQGSHTYYVSVVSPNSGTDYNSKNNLLSSAFNVGTSTGTAPPITEGFTLTTFPPTGWINVNCTNDAYQWARSTSYGGYQTSTNSAWINFYNIAAGNADELIVKPVDLTGGPIATLLFDVAYAQYSSSYVDTLAVMVSTNCGSTWDTPYQKYGDSLVTNGIGTYVTVTYTPTATQWRTETVDLSPYTGSNSQGVFLKFHAGSGYGNNCYIDNINVTISTSIKNNPVDKNIEIYPNPSNGQINITGFNNANISIFNLLGDKVMEINNATGNKQLDLSRFDSGAYIVQILSDKKVVTKKLLLDK